MRSGFKPSLRLAASLSVAFQLTPLIALLAGCNECVTDTDCESGQVCEFVPGQTEPGHAQGHRQCVDGCHEDTQCGAGQSCQTVECVTAPCPGMCVPSDACSVDDECPAGSVCELSTGCSAPSACVPGCHDDSQCGGGQSCNIVQCITCPCPGTCEPSPSQCESDADCSKGNVCELSTGCHAPSSCVLGCHNGAQCPAGQGCAQPQCLTCPCPGSCVD
jgi:hypothetical protein